MRVLVVEDSRSLADVLVEGLRDQGMAVDAAHDGLERAATIAFAERLKDLLHSPFDVERIVDKHGGILLPLQTYMIL